jgi:threonine synthase
MKLISTRAESNPVSFMQAMNDGLAVDGGLYVPQEIPKLSLDFWESLSSRSLHEIGLEMAKPYLENELDEDYLQEVIGGALNFDIPLIELPDNRYILELFHGPTLAFKDVGARFMARLFSPQAREFERDAVILVATSGDTGSAVAHGFLNVPGIHVCLLYPSGKVSKLQEQQMTTLGGNIAALEVEGTFDDCQRMVKEAFADSDLSQKVIISSANSINVARLLPQSFYYAHAVSQLADQLPEHHKAPVFSVPSGNLGNLTAGIMAMQMGLPVRRFLAATNSNDILPKYLDDGVFEPRSSLRTISNAMDVGDPSNFARIRYLFDHSDAAIREHIWGKAFADEATRACIGRVYRQTGYVLDPHTAVGHLAAEAYREQTGDDAPQIILATAHPAKFREVVEEAIGEAVELPERLEACLDKQKKSRAVDPDVQELKAFLLDNYS